MNAITIKTQVGKIRKKTCYGQSREEGAVQRPVAGEAIQEGVPTFPVIKKTGGVGICRNRISKKISA